MLVLEKISMFFYFLCKWPLRLWLKTRVTPESFESLDLDLSKPICYVMESRSTSNLALLDIQCKKLGLPSPRSTLGEGDLAGFRSVYSVLPKENQRAKYAHINKDISKLKSIVNLVSSSNGAVDVQFVPAFVLWGRPVGKETTWYQRLFSDSWNIVGRFRQTVSIILNGRNTLLQFHPVMSVQTLLAEHAKDGLAGKCNDMMARILFDARHATIGPDLSGRQLMMREILKSVPVKRAMVKTMKEKDWSKEKTSAEVRKYVDEIAASYSASAIKIFEMILSWVWDKIYDGVEVSNFDVLKQAAKGNGVIYVPCHRSHIDYLLLSYVLYNRNIAPPHIAAGINLNLPLIGSFLRASGAFFMRRSFRGNPLYSAVFNEYMHQNLIRGVSMEYFVEGGRSRTGRTLPARPGMLQMTLRSYLRNSDKPLVFVPTYIGYEKLIESKTYVRELGGQKKKKESIFGLIRAFSQLKGSFGKVYLNFAEPIHLTEFLNETRPSWQTEQYDAEFRPEWLSNAVTTLGNRITQGINDAAVVNPVNLVANVLLSTPKRAMGEEELVRQIKLYMALLEKAPYSSSVALPKLSPVECVKYVETTGLLQRHAHNQGDVLMLDEKSSILMTYYRNNIMHLFAIPSLIASCFIIKREMPDDQVVELVRVLYPFFRRELTLHELSGSDVERVAKDSIDVLLDMGLLVRHWDTNELRRPTSTDVETMQLQVMAESTRPMLERYYMAAYMLNQLADQALTVDECQSKMVSLAKRMSMLYELNAPEYSDKSLFVGLIHTLEKEGYASIQNQSDDKQLIPNHKALSEFIDKTKVLLNQKMRHSILQIVVK